MRIGREAAKPRSRGPGSASAGPGDLPKLRELDGGAGAHRIAWRLVREYMAEMSCRKAPATTKHT